MTHSREELALVQVEHEEAQDSGKNLETLKIPLYASDLAEEGEVDEDGVAEGDGAPLQGPVARRHRHHHRVDRHQDLGRMDTYKYTTCNFTFARLFSFSPAVFQL